MQAKASAHDHLLCCFVIQTRTVQYNLVVLINLGWHRIMIKGLLDKAQIGSVGKHEDKLLVQTFRN